MLHSHHQAVSGVSGMGRTGLPGGGFASGHRRRCALLDSNRPAHWRYRCFYAIGCFLAGRPQSHRNVPPDESRPGRHGGKHELLRLSALPSGDRHLLPRRRGEDGQPVWGSHWGPWNSIPQSARQADTAANPWSSLEKISLPRNPSTNSPAMSSLASMRSSRPPERASSRFSSAGARGFVMAALVDRAYCCRVLPLYR